MTNVVSVGILNPASFLIHSVVVFIVVVVLIIVRIAKVIETRCLLTE
jgi:hypothetical protein